MSRELTLSQLTTELTDFLGLPADLHLPPVREVSCKRTLTRDWRIEAHLDGSVRSDGQRYEDAAAWAALGGGLVEVGDPYAAAHQPSGMQRTLSVRITVAGVQIELYVCVDGLFAAPQSQSAVAP